MAEHQVRLLDDVASGLPPGLLGYEEAISDMASAMALSAGDDLIHVTSLASRETSVLILRCGEGAKPTVEVSVRPTPIVHVGWAFGGEAGDQRADLLGQYEVFRTWLGRDSVLFRQGKRRGRLIVKVDSSSLWFLKFPLAALQQLKLGLPGLYSGIEWITTGKTFVEHCQQRNDILRELSNVPSIVEGAVIILNTYREHARLRACVEGTRAIVEILSLFRGIATAAGGERSLRWYANPASATVKECLCDKTARYVFANFEAGRGFWETGEGERRQWSSEEVEAGAPSEPIELDPRVTSLSHIRLLRVFHCNSVFDPYAPDREPASHETIVGKLLLAGAWRVEGGMTKEWYTDYIASIGRWITDESGLGFVGRMKAIEQGKNWEGMRADLFRALKS